MATQPQHPQTPIHSSPYIGRFAPSPTGNLHFGSLVGALASFLDARAMGGRWLVRIEDLDPPREVRGSSNAILESLENHHLLWDDSILYQSTRVNAYQETLSYLSNHQLTFECSCSRKTAPTPSGIYSGHCRNIKHRSEVLTATRLKVYDLPTTFKNVPNVISFNDIFMGIQNENISSSVGDYIIHRKDGLFAYQLAVVVDDIYQKITHVIRGSDLLSSTAQQIFLYRLLDKELNKKCYKIEPQYGHFPVVLNPEGNKLSKKDSAKRLDEKNPSKNIFRALVFLQQAPPTELEKESPDVIIQWAIRHWRRIAIPKTKGLQESRL
ncbi:MAG: tRNA glutamyl-Q(34) synthetase GluQRS [Cellvibrionaceae bacterium]